MREHTHTAIITPRNNTKPIQFQSNSQYSSTHKRKQNEEEEEKNKE